jgi:dTDP-4-dehydrorhamnose reductase
MKILVAGRNGQLAVELLRAAWPAGTRITALGREKLNIAERDAVAAAVTREMPDLIINAAAYTAVDRAETEPEAAFAVNRDGPLHLALAAADCGIPLIHLSTDYVFDGNSPHPWREDDEPNPLGIYARSKLEGERAVTGVLDQHIILRTSWVFAAHGQNFVRTMLRLGAERDTLRIVDDQRGCPTSAADLARVIVAVASRLAQNRNGFGFYHYASEGPATWYEFAVSIFAKSEDIIGKIPSLVPISTAEFAAPAPRPANSVLDCRKIETVLGISARPWTTELDAVLGDIRSGKASSPITNRPVTNSPIPNSPIQKSKASPS